MKRITLLFAALLLSACHIHTDESRRNKLLRFAASHPVAAKAIGLKGEDSINITSNSTRFAEKTGLDNKANGEGRGTQVNAFRHALWQAAVASRFGTDIAKKVGDANEDDASIRERKTKYFSRFAADQAVDLRNNRIGRTIGAANPEANIKVLAQSVLTHFHKEGLWTAKPVKEKGYTYWMISQSKLSKAEFQSAQSKINLLNLNGFTDEEQEKYDADKAANPFKNNIFK